MGVLQTLKKDDANTQLNELTNSPIKAWLVKHGLTSLEKYEELKKSNFQKPLTVQAGGDFDHVNRLKMWQSESLSKSLP